MTIIEIMARALAKTYGGREDMWEGWQQDPMLCIAALTAAGFQIVPVEPSWPMVKAGVDALPSVRDTWTAMLQAAKDGAA